MSEKGPFSDGIEIKTTNFEKMKNEWRLFEKLKWIFKKISNRIKSCPIGEDFVKWLKSLTLDGATNKRKNHLEWANDFLRFPSKRSLVLRTKKRQATIAASGLPCKYSQLEFVATDVVFLRHFHSCNIRTRLYLRFLLFIEYLIFRVVHLL